MTTIDIDAIRQRYAKLESFADQEATGLRGMAYNTAVALAANLSASDVPDLCDEVEQLRAAHDSAVEAIAEAESDIDDRDSEISTLKQDLHNQTLAAWANRSEANQLTALVKELTAERDAARDMANTARNEAAQALHALDQARAVVEAAKAWRAQFAKPAATKAPRMASLIAAVDALPEPHADLYGDGHWVNRDGTCWSDCPACHPITTEATADGAKKPCCGYGCNDNLTGVA